MNIKDRLEIAQSEIKTAKLHGHTRLDLLRDGKVVHRLEKDNTITPWVQNVFGSGNMHLSLDPSIVMPIETWFKGCLLTDAQEDPSLMMIGHSSNITAQAGDDAYSGTYTKRGSFNETESGVITGGVRHVWDWSTSQGNGVINSVCLTRPNCGRTHVLTAAQIAEGLGSSSEISSSGYSTETIGSTITAVSASDGTAALSDLSIIDYASERGYVFAYSSGTVTVSEYLINSNRFHLLGMFGRTAQKISEHTISLTLPNYSPTEWRFYGSIMVEDGHLLVFYTPNSKVVYEVDVDLTEWTGEITSHTYSISTNFTYGDTPNTSAIRHTLIPKVGNYLFLFGVDNNIYKANITNDADIEIVGAIGDARYQNGGAAVLPNGDWIKGIFRTNSTNYGQCGAFWHNDQIMYIREYPVGASVGGVALFNTVGGVYLPTSVVKVPFGYVSTVNNLDEAVTKTADLTMKLSYEITEVTE